MIVDIPAYSPASQEEAFSGFSTPNGAGRVKADDEGAIVITPEPVNGAGLLRTWNYKNIPWWSDDQLFLSDVLEDVNRKACVDTARVLLTGFAVGGVFASIVACAQTERFTALATVSGLYSAADCRPSKPLPVLSFHGTEDNFIPYDGGVGDGAARLGLSDATAAGMLFMAARPGATASLRAWAEHNRCAPTPQAAAPATDLTRSRYTGCANGSSVELYTIAGGSHTWPGSTGMSALTPLLGPVTTTIDATDIIWDFFAHTWSK